MFDDVLQEALLATYRRDGARGETAVHFLTPLDEGTIRVDPAGSFTLPIDPGQPWVVPRTPAQALLIEKMREMPDRLADWGYTVSTGPLVWNRHKDQLRREGGPGCLPLVWAEAVAADGRFGLRSAKVNHQPFFAPREGDDWLITTRPCVLVQRTTAKEQARRLVAAVLPAGLLRRYGGAVVENHLNMVRPLAGPPAVDAAVLAAFLDSAVADEAFRCLSGSVAVSAYELEALPVPAAGRLGALREAVAAGGGRDAIDGICAGLYGLR